MLIIVALLSTSYGTSTKARVGADSMYNLGMDATEQIYMANLTEP